MRFLFRSLILALLLGASGKLALGQSPNSDRCDWADCKTRKEPVPAAGDTWTAPAGSLPRCSAADRSGCADQCRREFDSRYHSCVDGCLAKRCVVPTPTPVPQPGQEVGAPCVEIESPICNEDCKTETSSRQPRCRRDCLQKACPEASAMDITSESLDPGTFRCERCKKRFEISCTRNCSIGMIGSYNGLESYGCQKACVMTNCSKSCGIGLPFQLK